MSDTFVCAVCRGTFPLGSEEEAEDELRQVWPDAKKEDCEMVCDGCWDKIKPPWAMKP